MADNAKKTPFTTEGAWDLMKKIPNMSQEDKEKLLKFFRSNPGLTMEDFTKVLAPYIKGSEPLTKEDIIEVLKTMEEPFPEEGLQEVAETVLETIKLASGREVPFKKDYNILADMSELEVFDESTSKGRSIELSRMKGVLYDGQPIDLGNGIEFSIEPSWKLRC